MGTEKEVSPSRLVRPSTVRVAESGNGHSDGGAPRIDGGVLLAANGSQGQLCWGVKDMVTEQDCPGNRENEVPSDDAQVSCSVKLGSPVKSLSPGSWLSVFS